MDRLKLAGRNGEMLELRRQGMSMEEIAARFGLSRATVRSTLQTERLRRAFSPLQHYRTLREEDQRPAGAG